MKGEKEQSDFIAGPFIFLIKFFGVIALCFFLAKVIKNIHEKTMLSIRPHLAIRLDLSVMICLSGKRSSRWDIRHTDGISGLVFLGIPPVLIL